MQKFLKLALLKLPNKLTESRIFHQMYNIIRYESEHKIKHFTAYYMTVLLRQ